MDIDLLKVIGYSKDSLQSRALMRSIMLDLYPGKTREMNILLDVFESGVPQQIKKEGNISVAQYSQYIQKIINDYGMQEEWAIKGLNEWIDVCLGVGTSKNLDCYDIIEDNKSDTNESIQRNDDRKNEGIRKEPELFNDSGEIELENADESIELYNDACFRVVFQGIYRYSDESRIFNLSVENRTKQKICVGAENLLINRYQLNFSNNWANISANCKYLAAPAFDFIIDSEDVMMYGTKTIDNISFELKIQKGGMFGDELVSIPVNISFKTPLNIDDKTIY